MHRQPPLEKRTLVPRAGTDYRCMIRCQPPGISPSATGAWALFGKSIKGPPPFAAALLCLPSRKVAVEELDQADMRLEDTFDELSFCPRSKPLLPTTRSVQSPSEE
jgi:hypothetical protein